MVEKLSLLFTAALVATASGACSASSSPSDRGISALTSADDAGEGDAATGAPPNCSQITDQAGICSAGIPAKRLFDCSIGPPNSYGCTGTGEYGAPDAGFMLCCP